MTNSAGSQSSCKVAVVVLSVLLFCCIVAIAVVVPILATRNCKSSADSDQSTSCPSQSCSFCSEENTHDVIIVGGGPGGTYLAYRLRQNETMNNDKILLLEANNRIGGRLHSVEIPGIDYNMAEVGGMRYIPEVQPLITNVIKELNIENKVFEMDETNDDRPYLLRDFFVQQKYLTTAKLPYNLKEDEKHMTPNDIQIKYFEETIPPSERSKSYYDAYTIYGDPLYYYGLANVFALANASSDAKYYFQDGNGYSYPIPQNPGAAGNLVGASNDTSMSSGYRTPIDGMQAVPIQLARSFQAFANSQVKLNSTVTAINQCSREGSSAKLYLVTTVDSVTGVKTTYCGKKVVLSLTRSQLNRIDWEPLRTSPKADLVDAVASHKASKFFLVFPDPWWRKPQLSYLNLTKGRSISSLEIRQTFYFTPPDGKGLSLLMAYNDGPNAEFWGALTDRKFSRYSETMDFLYQMNDVLVDEAVRQIAINHNTSADVIGRPVQGVVMFWDHDTVPTNVPNYGPNMPSEAWHMWKAGYNATQVMKDITQLDPNQDVFIIGSAYSNNQGWTEGALETVEDLLKDKFSHKPLFADILRQPRPLHP